VLAARERVEGGWRDRQHRPPRHAVDVRQRLPRLESGGHAGHLTDERVRGEPGAGGPGHPAGRPARLEDPGCEDDLVAAEERLRLFDQRLVAHRVMLLLDPTGPTASPARGTPILAA